MQLSCQFCGVQLLRRRQSKSTCFNCRRQKQIIMDEKRKQERKLEGRDFAREKIRMRDNHTCQLCGLKWKPGTRRLDIHHLDANKDKTRQYDKPSEVDNCITLCHSCHLSLPVHRAAMERAARKGKKKEISIILPEKKQNIPDIPETQKPKFNIYL